MTMAWVAITALARTASVAAGRDLLVRHASAPGGCRQLPEQSAVPMRCVGGAWHAIGTECADADPGDAGIEVKPSVRIPKVGGPAGRSRMGQPASKPSVRARGDTARTTRTVVGTRRSRTGPRTVTPAP